MINHELVEKIERLFPKRFHPQLFPPLIEALREVWPQLNEKTNLILNELAGGGIQIFKGRPLSTEMPTPQKKRVAVAPKVVLGGNPFSEQWQRKIFKTEYIPVEVEEPAGYSKFYRMKIFHQNLEYGRMCLTVTCVYIPETDTLYCGQIRGR